MLVVSDVEDVFVPLLDGFFVTLEESESVIDRYVYIYEFPDFNFLYVKIKYHVL
jgi:hypothetical protein